VWLIWRAAIWTDLSRHLDEELTKAIAATSKFWKTLDQGAATTLVAAFDPALGGELLLPCGVCCETDEA
jgi:hypothetical protein